MPLLLRVNDFPSTSYIVDWHKKTSIVKETLTTSTRWQTETSTQGQEVTLACFRSIMQSHPTCFHWETERQLRGWALSDKGGHAHLPLLLEMNSNYWTICPSFRSDPVFFFTNQQPRCEQIHTSCAVAAVKLASVKNTAGAKLILVKVLKNGVRTKLMCKIRTKAMQNSLSRKCMTPEKKTWTFGIIPMVPPQILHLFHFHSHWCIT